jgi:UDP-N-acetyl-2-amino-2-deoxyglucuronate dehydrogenase
MMGKLRVMIAGAGNAGKTIASCMDSDGRAETVAFCEPVAGQREKAAGQFPAALIGEDFLVVLEESAPDVVVVAGPDHLHAEQAIAALEHGCHVLIEKPMATSVADVRRLLEAEAQSGLHVMVDFTFRYSHPWSTMALAAKAGEVGPVFFLEGNYIHDMWSHYSPDGEHYTPWRVDPVHPQNILLGGGCHGLDLMLWVMQDDPVREVYCRSNHTEGSPFPGDDCYLATLSFASGAIGKMLVTGGCNGAEFGGFLEVYGSDGTLCEGKLLRRGCEPVVLPEPAGLGSAGGHGWPCAIADFLSVLAGEKVNPIPSVMGARNVAVCEAAILSALDGAPREVEWFA